ncbi:hypothetical protein CR513_29393, partial [Mucuna pruriens]
MSLSETEFESSLSETNPSSSETNSKPPPSKTSFDRIIVGIPHTLKSDYKVACYKKINKWEGHPPTIAHKRNSEQQRSTEEIQLQKNSAYLNRDCSNWQHFDSESNKELKGLSYEGYRRLKRQKMRKMLKHCIWNVTLSSPRRDTNNLEDYYKPNEISDRDDVARKIDEEVKPRRKSKSDFDSEFENFSSWKSSCGANYESNVVTPKTNPTPYVSIKDPLNALCNYNTAVEAKLWAIKIGMEMACSEVAPPGMDSQRMSGESTPSSNLNANLNKRIREV